MTGIVNRVASYIGQSLNQGTDLLTGGDSGKFDVFSTLSTGLTLASAGATYFSARDQAKALQLDARVRASASNFEARDAEIESSREALRGKQEANLLMDDLLQTLAAQRATYANNGADITFGTPAAIGKNTQKISEEKLATAGSDTQLNRLALRRQAAARRQDAQGYLLQGASEAKNVRRTGTINALGSIAGLIDRRIARG